MIEGPAQEPPCLFTLETGKHEWHSLHSRHFPNAKFWIPYCPTCNWIDTEKIYKEVFAEGYKAGLEAGAKVAEKGTVAPHDTEEDRTCDACDSFCCPCELCECCGRDSGPRIALAIRSLIPSEKKEEGEG